MAKKLEVKFNGTIIVPDDITNNSDVWAVIHKYLQDIEQDDWLEPTSYELAPFPMQNRG